MIDRSLLDDTFTLTCDVSGCTVETVYDPAQLDRSANPDETSMDRVIAQAKADGWDMRQTSEGWKESCPKHRTT